MYYFAFEQLSFMLLFWNKSAGNKRCLHRGPAFLSGFYIDRTRLAPDCENQSSSGAGDPPPRQGKPRLQKYIPALKAAFNNEENLPAENSGALRYELSLLLEEAHRNTARAALEAQAYPPTGLILLDILLEEKVRECREKQILFSGCVLESPRFLLGHPIGLQPLLAVIANLVDNAIRAVSHPCVKEKMIVLHFGQAAGRIYQITIADSGIPFTIRTLENLGAVGNTTGGSGYGIASIIETCQKVHASVKLTEYGEHVTGFSKKICISFSGQFRIEIISPRWKELRPKYGYITVTQP